MRSLAAYGLTAALVVAFLSASFTSTTQSAPRPAEESAVVDTTDWPATPPRRVRSESALAMHRLTLKRFIAREGFGITRMGASIPVRYAEVDGSNHLVSSHRLIGAWRSGQPRLYDHAPHLTSLKTGPRPSSSPLKALDAAAVQMLEDGGSLVASADDTVLFGAIRASGQCAECHAVEIGTLLGAFRYELVAWPDPNPDRTRAPRTRSIGR